jgi:5-methylcytosine-specific restriction protein B
MMLDDRVLEQINRLHEELTSRGELPTRAQLEQYYSTFRERFGPQRLASLDGEALLETMHDHGNRDSLVYWLEFKNDEEFPALFGSIAGGSALKFGIYRRKETGMWTTGIPKKQQELSAQEAIQIARKHRDQFIEGVRLLQDLPPHATDEEYAALQAAMDSIAPDVSNTAWGHKYFSLLHPGKLDDYHMPDYQRFHLITLLQQPPPGDGRYIVAGRYVALADLLNMPLNHFTEILNHIHARPHRYWRVGTKLGGVDSRWELMRNSDCVAIGWQQLGDLSDIRYSSESKERIRSLIHNHYPNTPQAVGRDTQQVFNFVTVLREGDLVLPSDGKRVLGIGRVVGEYAFEPTSDAPHRRPVEWLSWAEWELPSTEGLQSTVRELRLHVGNLIEIEGRVLYAPPLPPRPEPRDTEPIPSRPPIRLPGVSGRIQAVLERKKQVILYGPPGTGKTYWAMIAAQELAAYFRFGRRFEQLADEKKSVVLGKDEYSDGLVRMCTFHPAYGYEDFLEGYKPVSVNDQLLFEKRDGIFKKLCDDAGRNRQHRYYLIIDEINRGDIPRIFGELLTILEKDKREKPILLPLSGQPFHVPDNVHVIGTMNTADRSIALLDTALRRRFGFVELMPDTTILGDVVVGSIPLGAWLDALNCRICDHLGRDARNLQIGHAYLLDRGEPVSEFSKFARVIQDDIVPLLEEYCYEDYSALERILGKGLVDVNNLRIRHELFSPSREYDLVQALLEPCPEIVTSSQAVASEVDEADKDLDEGEEADDSQNDEQA